MRHELPAVMVSFDEGGRTIYVHGADGTILLKIMARGEIVVHRVDECCGPRCDIYVEGDVCIELERKVS